VSNFDIILVLCNGLPGRCRLNTLIWCSLIALCVYGGVGTILIANSWVDGWHGAAHLSVECDNERSCVAWCRWSCVINDATTHAHTLAGRWWTLGPRGIPDRRFFEPLLMMLAGPGHLLMISAWMLRGGAALPARSVGRPANGSRVSRIGREAMCMSTDCSRRRCRHQQVRAGHERMPASRKVTAAAAVGCGQ